MHAWLEVILQDSMTLMQQSGQKITWSGTLKLEACSWLEYIPSIRKQMLFKTAKQPVPLSAKVGAVNG